MARSETDRLDSIFDSLEHAMEMSSVAVLDRAISTACEYQREFRSLELGDFLGSVVMLRDALRYPDSDICAVRFEREVQVPDEGGLCPILVNMACWCEEVGAWRAISMSLEETQAFATTMEEAADLSIELRNQRFLRLSERSRP